MTRVVAVVQARRGSSRYPDKVLADVCGHPLLWHVLERARHIAGVDALVLTTPPEDAGPLTAVMPTVAWAPHWPPDVLSGFARAARDFRADVILRITGDCPLLCPELAWFALQAAVGYDYWATTRPVMTVPDGLDVEVIRSTALRIADVCAHGPEREHVTAYLYAHPEMFRCGQPVPMDPWACGLKLSVDTEADLARVRRLMAVLPPGDYTHAATLTAAKEIGL